MDPSRASLSSCTWNTAPSMAVARTAPRVRQRVHIISADEHIIADFRRDVGLFILRLRRRRCLAILTGRRAGGPR
jgi:hypothetical protein